MAITIRDMKAGRDTKPGAAPVQRNIASLVGGYVIALGCLVLFLLVASEFTALTPVIWVAGLMFAAAIGVWIRVADL